MEKIIKIGIPSVLAATLLLSGVASARGFGVHGMGGGMMGGFNITPEQAAINHQEMFTKQASMLGVSVDVVKNGWAAGKSMQQIAAENGITKEQLKQKMQDLSKLQRQAHLKALVDKGVITQAQADARLASFANAKQNGGDKEKRKGAGMMGGFKKALED